jgi:DNA-damage-inducible protein J
LILIFSYHWHIWQEDKGQINDNTSSYLPILTTTLTGHTGFLPIGVYKAVFTFGILKMTTDSVVRSRIDPQIKDEASRILDELGLTLSDGIRMFLTQVILTKGLPFPVTKTPNARLVAAVKELDSGGGRHFSTVDDLMSDLKNDEEDDE